MAKSGFKNSNNNNKQTNKPWNQLIPLYYIHTTVSRLDFINTLVKDIFALEFMPLPPEANFHSI